MKISDANTSDDTSHQVTPPPTSSISFPTFASEASVISSENSTDTVKPLAPLELDESELGEFLMDTFEGLDPFETTDTPELIV